MKDGSVVSEAQRAKNREAFEAMFNYLSATQSNMDFKLTDNFSLKSPVPEKGQPYFAATCSQCKQLTPFVRDPSNGKLKFQPEDYFLETDCQNCGKLTRADWANLKSIQWK